MYTPEKLSETSCIYMTISLSALSVCQTSSLSVCQTFTTDTITFQTGKKYLWLDSHLWDIET